MSETRDHVEAALNAAFREQGEYVTRFVLAAESIDDEGQRGVWLLSPEDMHDWETVGILTYALQLAQARTNEQLLMGDDDGNDC